MFIYIIPHPSALSSQSETVFYRGIHKKGSDDVVSAVCVQRGRYIMYIVQQTTETTSSELFRVNPPVCWFLILIMSCIIINDTTTLLIVLLNVHVIFSFFQPSIGPTQLNHIFSRIKTIYCLLIEKEQNNGISS